MNRLKFSPWVALLTPPGWTISTDKSKVPDGKNVGQRVTASNQLKSLFGHCRQPQMPADRIHVLEMYPSMLFSVDWEIYSGLNKRNLYVCSKLWSFPDVGLV